MSCNGNRFSCGMRRFDKHTTYDNKPNNIQLHNEADKRLQEMLNARALQDKGIFTPIQTNIPHASQPSELNHGKTS